MKVFLQNDDCCRVVTVNDGEIDLNHYDDLWDVHTRTEFNGEEVDVCITGQKTAGYCSGINYDAPVLIEVYDIECDDNLFVCRSHIVADEYSATEGRVIPELLTKAVSEIL